MHQNFNTPTAKAVGVK